LDSVERIVNEEGCTAVGFLAYEAAPAFDPALSTIADGDFPLLWFGLFKQPDEFDHLPIGRVTSPSKLSWRPSLTHDEYRSKIDAIHEYIQNGDTYQVNFSFRMRTNSEMNPPEVFDQLMTAQETRYAAFIDTGEWIILSASPELFFRLEGDLIESKPMKGTAARGLWYDDDCRKAEMLLTSEKERAENLMIVDMVRNDIGRVADIGSVHVPALFALERYPTVWQMTSTVCGRTKAPLSGIFRALFPPASVTGAPKRRAMEIITELESSPRRIYTGTIGRIAPDRRAQFSVAIRTLLFRRNDGRAEYGIGSGIVWDSERDGEWEECSVKARVLHAGMPEFDLVETMIWSPDNGYSLLEYHLRRLEQSAAYFGFKIDIPGIRDLLNRIASGLPALSHRVRLVLSRGGAVDIKADPLEPEKSGFGSITIAGSPIHSSNVFLYHKTTNRRIYEEAMKASPGFDDVILFNEKGQVTETTIANIAVEIGRKLYTPPVNCGLLAGIYRAWLIEQKRIWERIISLDELRQSPNVYLMNSVRGIQKVSLFKSR
jgi:para-aminobenzoate synthetase/4-amino-4-deoxychorismate lyase